MKLRARFTVAAPHEEPEVGEGLRLLLIALATAVLYHGGLLPFTHGNTYDAFIHMFFGDSYHRSWFDPWEPRWYTGFATTSYPPGTHMAIALLQHVMPIRWAFAVVQLTGLLLLTIGVYRFSLLWVTARPAGYAAISLVLASSISETIHLFGQLPTICSLGIFLNGLPHVYRWIVAGRWRDFGAAVLCASATTAAHHVTTIFGGVLFILPLGLQALRSLAAVYEPVGRKAWTRLYAKAIGRGLFLGIFMLSAIIITVFPYWWWSINDPITQVPIPHGSRESFIERLDLGFIFFLLPWGTALLVLPYVVWKTITTRLWPLGSAVLLCFVLGTGGTTPVPRMLLGGAFDILTLDRFTFWGSILILPFIGYLMDGLLHGRSGEALRAALGKGLHRILIGGWLLAMVLVSVFAAILPTMQPTQPDFIDPKPIVAFLEQDEHDRWRYLTLGFGDQFAYMSSLTTAQSVDGNYHSARRLPDMTRFSVERLENAKYLGVPGLGSLQQFLVNADQYNLKYVFSNDEFYDPLLHFSGWNRLNKLPNGITVWEKPDISPLPVFTPRREISPLHMLMWGVIPPTALSLAALVFILSAFRRNFVVTPKESRPLVARELTFRYPLHFRIFVISVLSGMLITAAVVAFHMRNAMNYTASPQEVIQAYFGDLDFRRLGDAYQRLDPVTRPSEEEVRFNWRWRGGLIASYGKLTAIRITRMGGNERLVKWQVELDWLTSLNMRTETLDITTVLREGEWYVAPSMLRATQSPARLQRQTDVNFNLPGRRQPRADTDIHRDRLDRPTIATHGARLVEHKGRYSVIGAITNTDADPAHLTVLADLVADNRSLARSSVATLIGQRLLPGETSGFRVGFEGVLSLDDARDRKEFDPTLFIPPELDAEPQTARIEARALVAGQDLYRGVSLNGVTVTDVRGNPVIEGLAVNAGTKTASIVRIVVLAYDGDGKPIWIDAGYVETNIYPGQSAPFRIELPPRDDIRVIADLQDADAIINGSSQDTTQTLPGPGDGTIATGIAGYAALRLQVSSMTHDPLF